MTRTRELTMLPGSRKVTVSPISRVSAPGPNGLLDTTAGGDDVVDGTQINTGADGICNSTARGDDVQIVGVGKGAPDKDAITPGKNGTLDSTAAGDDTT